MRKFVANERARGLNLFRNLLVLEVKKFILKRKMHVVLSGASRGMKSDFENNKKQQILQVVYSCNSTTLDKTTPPGRVGRLQPCVAKL